MTPSALADGPESATDRLARWISEQGEAPIPWDRRSPAIQEMLLEEAAEMIRVVVAVLHGEEIR